MATNTQLRNILRTIVIIDKEAKCKDNQQHNLTSGLNDFIELKIKDLTDMRYIYIGLKGTLLIKFHSLLFQPDA